MILTSSYIYDVVDIIRMVPHTTTQMILQDGAQILTEEVTKFAYWSINGGSLFHLRRRSRLPNFVNLFMEAVNPKIDLRRRTP